MSEPPGLFSALSGAADIDAVVADEALVRAMLRFEAELAAAQAELGLVPAAAAADVATAAESMPVDVADLGRRARAPGNPANPLVADLTAALPEAARPFVHVGTTSQDVLDTAVVLVLAEAGRRLRNRLDALLRTLEELARGSRDLVLPARTLGQQAQPTTFARKVAGWWVGLADAADRLDDVVDRRLAVQLGGAAGTLADLDGRGTELVAVLARRLGLAEPLLPWHADRGRLLETAAALAGVVAAAGKTATDLVLLAQTELREAVPASGGGSTAMPQKANPVDAILVRALALRVPGLLATLFTAAAQHEHERGAGAWHAEWEPLRELARLTGGAVDRLAAALDGLRADPDRMRADLELTGGLLASSTVAARLAPALGRSSAHETVSRAVRTAVDEGRALADVLGEDPEVRQVLGVDEITEALAPERQGEDADRLVARMLDAADRRRAVRPDPSRTGGTPRER